MFSQLSDRIRGLTLLQSIKFPIIRPLHNYSKTSNLPQVLRLLKSSHNIKVTWKRGSGKTDNSITKNWKSVVKLVWFFTQKKVHKTLWRFHRIKMSNFHSKTICCGRPQNVGLILNGFNSIIYLTNITLQYVNVYPPSIHVYVSELLQCCFHSGRTRKKMLKIYAKNGRIVFEIVKLKVCKNSWTLICFFSFIFQWFFLHACTPIN